MKNLHLKMKREATEKISLTIESLRFSLSRVSFDQELHMLRDAINVELRSGSKRDWCQSINTMENSQTSFLRCQAHRRQCQAFITVTLQKRW
jgi:hypothetical protein